MVMAIDRQEASARSEFEIALEIIRKKNTQGHYELLRSHTDAWKAVWSQGLIEVDGNIQVCGWVNIDCHVVYTASSRPTLARQYIYIYIYIA